MALFGTEQEYGIALVGVDPLTAPHPMHLSNAVIRAYRDATDTTGVGYDYADESPLTDAWGFQLDRATADPELRTDESVLASRMLTNGARFYVDHAHPEYSGPEVTSVLDAVRYDRAGDLIMQAAAEAASATLGRTVRLFKNNTDGKGASYGTHENYLVDRAVPFADIVVGFTPFLVSRGVLVGAGRVGIEGGGSVFQLTQRADFFEREVGLETTTRRPIINTRDEPHADPATSRRLHVITGDANQSQVACYLKIGSAALVLGALAHKALPDLALADPVGAMHALSHDTTLRGTVRLADGRRLTGLDLQEAHLEACATWQAASGELGEEGADVLDCWRETLDLLRRDPMLAADRLDWAAKLRLLETYRERDGLGWDSPRLAAIDLQYAEIDPARSLARALERTGRLLTLVDDADVDAVRTEPPASTRAFLRGRLLRDFGASVWAVNWDSVSLELRGGRLRTLRLTDPLRHHRAETEAILAAAVDADDLVARLERAGL